MKIGIADKIITLFSIYRCVFHLPNKFKLYVLIKPLDCVRYTEFSFLLKYIKEINLTKGKKVLDISSPFMMSYILSRNFKVIKTDIYEEEKKYIKENNNLRFEKQDATAMIYDDNSFDFVYSISVIEHIFEKYKQAVQEMIRVTKNGGFIYLSFPVSINYTEEWLDSDIYSDQFKQDGKTFFQYRFDEEKLNNFLNSLPGTEVLRKSIYWERKNGKYNYLISLLKKKLAGKFISFFKDSFINFYYGFFLLNNRAGDFNEAKDFGNISLILKVVK